MERSDLIEIIVEMELAQLKTLHEKGSTPKHKIDIGMTRAKLYNFADQYPLYREYIYQRIHNVEAGFET